MNKRKTVMGAVLAVLTAAGAAWALGMFGNSDIAELQQLREQMVASRDLPDAERQQLRDEFRQRVESLSETQRRQFFESSREQWRQGAQQRMDEFFALPQQEQQVRLDQMIDRMIQRQNERAQNPNADNRGPGNGPPAGAGQGGGRRGGWANLSEAQRDQRAKQRLDRTSPKMRAQRNEFRRQLDERLQARGLSPDDFRGGFRGGWGRRG